MKHILMVTALSMSIVYRAFCGGTVMVNTNTGVILWPTNFALANGLSGTNSVAAATVRITALEAQTNGWASTNQYYLVSNRVTTIEGLTNGFATTNGLTALSNLVDTLEGSVLYKTNLFAGDISGVYSNITLASKVVTVTNELASGDIIYYAGTKWTKLPKGSDTQSLILSGGFPAWGSQASTVGITNTIGANSYTNTGFNLQAGSNVTARNTGGTNFFDVAASTISRYEACSDVNYEIQVMATGTGITAVIVGSSITVTIPSGVHLLSARIRWPGTVSTGFTINLGTTDMPNASFATRWGANFWACREDTGAFLPTATCKLDSSNHDQLIVAGLNDVSVNHCMLSF